MIFSQLSVSPNSAYSTGVQPTSPIKDDVFISDQSTCTVVRSPSFGEHFRTRASSSSRRRNFTSLDTERSVTTPASAKDEPQSPQNQHAHRHPSPLPVYGGPWTSKYDPLPSPLLELEKMELFPLSGQ
ncbi:unnamed protein product [Echinostoma caproni]|uniref:Uncharacterized protein n=1 Tax=Echinostoma caproni TaxID=27848 RepID=A0A183A7T7_9TREM|nr:unnamed protein product [Echinostoma caproni]